MAEVRFDRVTKTFGDRRRPEVVAVRDATFTVQDGEFVVFLGPSGCGKTTSLRMVAGLEVPTSGDIFIGDRLVNRLHPRARNVAMVFQDYALYPHMTVRENMSFALRNLRTPRAQIEQRVAQAAEMLQIGHLLNRRPRQLSGGQRQRVALGRAIVRSPDVFLFDEPLSNLDATLRVQMRVELLELHEKLGTTSIYVTHDQVEAMTLGQRIVVMNNGVIQQIDTPARTYDHPNNMFVARFIGSPPMNLVRGTLDPNAGLVGDGFRVFLSSAFLEQHAAWHGQEVYLGLRPEDLHVTDVDADPRPDAGGRGRDCVGQGELQARTKVVEYLGAEVLVYFELGSELGTARIPPGAAPRPHEEATFRCDLKRAALFDPRTQERLTP